MSPISIGENQMEKDFNFRWLASILFGVLFTMTIVPATLKFFTDFYSINIFLYSSYGGLPIAISLVFCIFSTLVLSQIFKKYNLRNLLVFLSCISLVFAYFYLVEILGFIIVLVLFLSWINFIFLLLEHDWARKTIVAFLCFVIGMIALGLANMVTNLQTDIYTVVLVRSIFFLISFSILMSALYFATALSTSRQK